MAALARPLRNVRLSRPSRGRKVAPPSVRATLSAALQPRTADHLIVVDAVSKSWHNDVGQVRGLQSVSFCMQPGEFTFLTGITGQGKTTLLRLLGRDLKPDTGSILLGGVDINSRHLDGRAYKQRIGVVQQTLDLVPNRTAEENIAMRLEYLLWEPRDIRSRVAELLDVFGLEHARSRLCERDAGMSGGELQRLAIARAIAHKPDLLLCDEPTGNLDVRTTYEVMRTLNQVSMLGTTVLCATHDPEVVNLMRKRVITIHDGGIASDQVGGYRLT